MATESAETLWVVPADVPETPSETPLVVWVRVESVSLRMLLVEVVAGANLALTSGGSPVSESVTLLSKPLKP